MALGSVYRSIMQFVSVMQLILFGHCYLFSTILFSLALCAPCNACDEFSCLIPVLFLFQDNVAYFCYPFTLEMFFTQGDESEGTFPCCSEM